MSWLTAKIDDVCVPTEQANPARYERPTFRYVDISSIDRDAKAISKAGVISAQDAPSRARKIIESSDILISTVRPNLNAVALVPDELHGEFASTGFAVLRANRLVLNPKFLYYWVQYSKFVDFLVANAKGANYPTVTDTIVKRAPIRLPTLREQSRIIDLLDEANLLRRLRHEAAAKVAGIMPALFLKHFGDPATNPMGWPEGTIGAVLVSADYGTSSRATGSKKDQPTICMGNIAYDGSLLLDDLKYFELSPGDVDKFRLERGDILFNRTNSLNLVGKTGLWSGEIRAVLASDFVRLRVDPMLVEPDFVWAFMNSAHMKSVLRAAASGTVGHANISATELRQFRMYLPPLNLQKHFVREVYQMKSALPSLGLESDLNSIFNLMQELAFSGRLTAKWRNENIEFLRADTRDLAEALNMLAPQEHVR